MLVKTILSILLFMPLLLMSQVIEQADHIAPEDIGAYKWTLKATGGSQEVVVFRITTTKDRNEKVVVDVYDTVRYFPNKEQSATVFIFDPSYGTLTDSPEKDWYFRALGSNGWISGKYVSSSTRPTEAKIKFSSKKTGSTEKKFEVFVLTYAEAKEIHPELPEMTSGGGWGWAGYPEDTREQDDADNPVNSPENPKKQLDD